MLSAIFAVRADAGAARDVPQYSRRAPKCEPDDRLETNLVTLNAGATVKEAAKLFARYSFRAIPIVGDRHAQLSTPAIYADAVGTEEKDIARRM